MTLIDISHTLSNDTPVYPGDDAICLTKRKSIEKNHYTAYYLESGLHIGTHIDLPMHLIDDCRTAGEFPVNSFAGTGMILDVRGEGIISMKPEYKKMICEDAVLLLYTGFDEYFYTDRYFTDYPQISMDFAEFLVSAKIKMIGFDTPAPDYPPFDAHKLFLSNGIFILENLTKLDALTETGSFEVMAFPLKIKAEASLVRAVCRVL